MSKLTNKDFEEYLGNDAYFDQEDKERVYRRIHPSKRTRRQWVPQVLTLALAIGFFAVGIQFFLGDLPFSLTGNDDEVIDSNPESKTDWSLWKTATSFENVDAYYESIVPGYRIARELNQIVAINQKHPLTDTISLYIDKAWYHEDKIYLFYSMDLSNDEVVENNHNTGILFDFLLHENDSTVNLKTESLSPWSGMVFNDAFNNKLYRVATIALEDEQQLLGSDQLTATFSIDAHNDDVTLSEIELPVSYGTEAITSNQLNETMVTMNSRITLKRFDHGADKGYLFGSVESDLGQEFSELNGTIQFNDGNWIYVMESAFHLYDGEFVLKIPELANEGVSIQFYNLSMIENEKTIDISIDVSDYDGNSFDEPVEKTLNEKIDELGNNNIFLRSILFDKQGVTVEISREKIDSSNTAQINFSFNIFPEGMMAWGYRNIISAVDNNGKTAKEHHFIPSEIKYGEYGSDIQSFGLTNNFIRGKEQIDVSIKRIVVWEEFMWDIEIPKQD